MSWRESVSGLFGVSYLGAEGLRPVSCCSTAAEWTTRQVLSASVAESFATGTLKTKDGTNIKKTAVEPRRSFARAVSIAFYFHC